MTDLKSRDISMAAHGKKNMTPYQQQLAENGERMYTAFRTVMNRRGGKRGNTPEPRWKNLKPWIKQVWIEAAASLVEPCGAQEWAYDENDKLIIYGTCDLPKGHADGWHQETRDSRLWAQWRGPVERAPGVVNV